MKIKLFPAAAVLGFAVIAGAGGAYALQAAAPAVVEQQQTPTVEFRSASAVDDAAAPEPTAAATPAAQVQQPVDAPAVEQEPQSAPRVVEREPQSAPKAKVAATQEAPAATPQEADVASTPAVPPMVKNPVQPAPGNDLLPADDPYNRVDVDALTERPAEGTKSP